MRFKGCLGGGRKSREAHTAGKHYSVSAAENERRQPGQATQRATCGDGEQEAAVVGAAYVGRVGCG